MGVQVRGSWQATGRVLAGVRISRGLSSEVDCEGQSGPIYSCAPFWADLMTERSVAYMLRNYSELLAGEGQGEVPSMQSIAVLSPTSILSEPGFKSPESVLVNSTM